MLTIRLVQMIEDHAEELTQGLIKDLQSNPRTPHYHQLTYDELHFRTYAVYRNLGHWITSAPRTPSRPITPTWPSAALPKEFLLRKLFLL